MNYIGSKKSLLEFLEKNINKVVWRKNYIFSDLFAGTWIVWRYFKEKWHSVIANDLQYYSFALNRNYIWNYEMLSFQGLYKELPELFIADLHNTKDIVLEYLDKLEPKKWFIYKNYSPEWTKGKEFERMYFSDENAWRCDAIRQKIEEWKKEEKINENEYYFLLASLLESIDKVANTASVYGAFLKKLKKSAQKTMTLKSADFHISNFTNKSTEGFSPLLKEWFQVFNKDVNDFILESSHDVVYLDPPYNHRQYSWNYHILETIALYDNPKIKWKTWMRDCSNQKSNYSKRAEVKKSFEKLIKNIDAKYVFLSYNCEWLMSHKEIEDIMSTRGDYWVKTKEYKRFKADKTENRNHKKESVLEYLHYVKINN